MEKAFDFGGMGGRNGVAAAVMVGAGMTGVQDPLEGKLTTCPRSLSALIPMR